MTRPYDFLARLAELTGPAVADQLAAEFGGRVFYMPVPPLTALDEKILAMFTGDNYAELADKLRVSVVLVYRAVRRQQAQQRQSLLAESLEAWGNACQPVWVGQVTQLGFLSCLQAVTQAAETAKAQGYLDRLVIAVSILPEAPPATPRVDTPAIPPDAPAGIQSGIPAHPGNPLPGSSSQSSV